MKVTPHVAQNKSNRKSAVPDEIASTEGYAISMQKRKLIEQGFGWAKFIGPIRQVMVRGIKNVDQVFMMAMAAYNLVMHAHFGTSPSGGSVMRVKGLRNDLESGRNGLEWGDATSQAARNIEQRDFTSAAELRALVFPQPAKLGVSQSV